MNFHEFGFGVGWVQVFVNVCLLINLGVVAVKTVVAVFKALD